MTSELIGVAITILADTRPPWGPARGPSVGAETEWENP